VARDDSPLWVILVVISIITLVIAAILIVVFSRVGGGVVLVAIPGFPPESLLLGFAVGLLIILARRRRA